MPIIICNIYAIIQCEQWTLKKENIFTFWYVYYFLTFDNHDTVNELYDRMQSEMNNWYYFLSGQLLKTD